MQITAAGILLSSLLLTPTHAYPLLSRQAQMCDQAPNAANTSPVPIAQPSVTTADLCRQQCGANAQCQSFVFGLPPSHDSPECRLFAVPAAQVPAQDNSELHVFDEACTGVPTQAPTRDDPRGSVAQTNGGANANGNAAGGRQGNSGGQQTQNGGQQTRNGGQQGGAVRPGGQA